MSADLSRTARRALLQRRRFLALAAAPLITSALAPLAARAQGFAGLGGGGSGFALPDPGYRMRFPEDHLPHPDFRIEWWYLTASLSDADGRPWGVQWTLFRSALAAGAPESQAFMGHAALTSEHLHLSAQRLARPGQAGVMHGPDGPLAFIDEWQLSGDPARALAISAGGSDFAFRLAGPATGPLVLQGAGGYSVKSPDGTASHYFSQPFLELEGEALTKSGPLRLTGQGWLDREWSSEPLSEDQSGWDWFSLTFGDGTRLMAFTVRGRAPFRTATWIAPDGQSETIASDQVESEPLRWAEVSGQLVPVAHRLRIAARGLDVVVEAIRDDCWMPMLFPYWEGPVRVTGSHSGRGYLEMTGYGPAKT